MISLYFLTVSPETPMSLMCAFCLVRSDELG